MGYSVVCGGCPVDSNAADTKVWLLDAATVIMTVPCFLFSLIKNRVLFSLFLLIPHDVEIFKHSNISHELKNSTYSCCKWENKSSNPPLIWAEPLILTVSVSVPASKFIY